MRQQRAIGTPDGQCQAVLIARFLMSWYAREELVLRGQRERKLAILALAGAFLKCVVTHAPEAGNPADFSVFAPSFRALFSFPFRSGGNPKGYMDRMDAARACSMAQYRQIPDENHVGFLPCARPARQAHLAEEETRLARHCRYLISDLAGASTTNVNFRITSVVVLHRRLQYTFLKEFSRRRNAEGKILVSLHAGGEDQLERPGPEEIRFQLSKRGDIWTPVLDFPKEESYSSQKAENAPSGLENRRARCF